MPPTLPKPHKDHHQLALVFDIRKGVNNSFKDRIERLLQVLYDSMGPKCDVWTIGQNFSGTGPGLVECLPFNYSPPHQPKQDINLAKWAKGSGYVAYLLVTPTGKGGPMPFQPISESEFETAMQAPDLSPQEAWNEYLTPDEPVALSTYFEDVPLAAEALMKKYAPQLKAPASKPWPPTAQEPDSPTTSLQPTAPPVKPLYTGPIQQVPPPHFPPIPKHVQSQSYMKKLAQLLEEKHQFGEQPGSDAPLSESTPDKDQLPAGLEHALLIYFFGGPWHGTHSYWPQKTVEEGIITHMNQHQTPDGHYTIVKSGKPGVNYAYWKGNDGDNEPF